MSETANTETGEQATDQTVEEMMSRSAHLDVDDSNTNGVAVENDDVTVTDTDVSDDESDDGNDDAESRPDYDDVDLDDRDRKILELLDENARMSFTDIAEQIGVTLPTVSERVSRMEEIGAIEKFTIEVNPRAVDTVEVSSRTLERLLTHASASRTDPATPWHEGDEAAYREARAVLGSEGGD